MQDLPTPSGDDGAQAASLTNTLTALTLVGVPVRNTNREEVIRSLQRVVEVTTRDHVGVAFTIRPRNCRPRTVERTGGAHTFGLRLTPEEIRHQQQVRMETVALAIYSGTVTLEPAREEDER